MRILTKEDKLQLQCDVSIRLCYTDCNGVRERFDLLCKYLYDANLVPVITKEECFGPCLNLNCTGTISLLDAELILSKRDEYYLPLEINYYYGRFLLRTEER